MTSQARRLMSGSRVIAATLHEVCTAESGFAAWSRACSLRAGGNLMGTDAKLAADEARRIAQHESVKGEVREKVHHDITQEAERRSASERGRAGRLADSLTQHAV